MKAITLTQPRATLVAILDKLAAYQRNKEAACAEIARCVYAGDTAGQEDAEFVYRWACAGIARMTPILKTTVILDDRAESKQ